MVESFANEATLRPGLESCNKIVLPSQGENDHRERISRELLTIFDDSGIPMRCDFLA
jgi:hypothetical protein